MNVGSSPVKRWPDFFIAGAAKAGTTSLWRYLLQHPQIYMPGNFREKEPSFFCDNYGLDDEKEYLDLFRGAPALTKVGEASGPYLTAPESAGRIHSQLPQAKFIIMLRNPAERAYSLYNWMIKEGYEKIPTFEEALGEENRRWENPNFRSECRQYHWNFLYFRSGLYGDQIQRYLELFSRAQIHFVLFESFKRDALLELKKIYSFLEIAETFPESLEVHNPASVPRSVGGQYFLRHRADRVFRRLLVPKRKQLIRYLMKRNTAGNVPVSLAEETRRALLDKYQQDFARTEELSGINLHEWFAPPAAKVKQPRQPAPAGVRTIPLAFYFCWAREFAEAAMV